MGRRVQRDFRVSLRIVSRSIWGNPGNRGQRIQRTLAAIAWQLRKRLLRSPLTLTLASGARFQAWPDCVVSSALVYADWPEHAELMFIRSRLTPEDAVVDVGANVGHLSLLLLDVADRNALFAFEPTPLTLRRLTENWRLNGLPEDNIAGVALGAESGTVLMPDTDRPETKNSVLSPETGGPKVEVPLHRLDDYRSRWKGRRIGLFKIDVEGYEAQVLAGATEFLLTDRPRLVMFESLGGGLDSSIARYFDEAGYTVFQLGADGRPVRGELDAQNLFAVPDSIAGELKLA